MTNENFSQKLQCLTYGFVGLGLMGGSLAKAIRKFVLPSRCTSQNGVIFAMDKNATSIENALSQGIIDRGFCENETQKMLSACDFVFVCLPPHTAISFLQENATFFKKDAIVTEISGVKNDVFRSFPNGISDDVHFIPSHPMAGNEREGFSFSSGDIFVGRNFIITPYENTANTALQTMYDLAKQIGFTNIFITDYKTHDHKIAFTSQLCHVIASSLVDCAEDTDITKFGGGSFEDLTRIALINAPLWTELFISNKEELVRHIENFEFSLKKLKNLIQSDDKDALKNALFAVREKRTQMASNVAR